MQEAFIHILGDYTPRNKRGLVCMTWTNRFVNSVSFEYALVRTITERYIFSSLASLHFSVMLYFTRKKFQVHRNVLYQSLLFCTSSS